MTFLEAKSADLASGEALDVVTERPQLASRVRDACSFELWTSLFADDCALLFQSRGDLIRGSSHIFAHLRKSGLCMHVGRGNAASKTEAMYFPPPRMAYEACGHIPLLH